MQNDFRNNFPREITEPNMVPEPAPIYGFDVCEYCLGDGYIEVETGRIDYSDGSMITRKMRCKACNGSGFQNDEQMTAGEPERIEL